MPERVKFYSASDLSSGHCLQLAEKILLNNIIDYKCCDINDVIELYNISLFFENEVYLDAWNTETKNNYINRVKQFK